jgi:hypothetical protein
MEFYLEYYGGCDLEFPEGVSLEPQRVPLPLGRTLVAGRAAPPARDIQLLARHISLTHFAVGRDEAGVWVRDLNSTNGTRVNGCPLPPQGSAHRLRPDDVIDCGAMQVLRLVAVVPVEPAWLAWRDGTISKLARAILDEQRYEELPILADALEDAGCTDPDILAHCRQPGEHSWGCWVIDLLLGKA